MELRLEQRDGKNVLVLIENGEKHVVAESKGQIIHTLSPKGKRLVVLLNAEMETLLYHLPTHKPVLKVSLKNISSLEYARDEAEERLAVAVLHGDKTSTLYRIDSPDKVEEEKFDYRIGIEREQGKLKIKRASE